MAGSRCAPGQSHPGTTLADNSGLALIQYSDTQVSEAEVTMTHLPLTLHRAFNRTFTQSDRLNFPLATNVPNENN